MSPRSPLDLLGVGVGPFNLGLAALADGIDDLRLLCLDERPAFRWHDGMLLPGTTLQVPFLADLVTLVDPTSRWSFLAYLREHGRLFPFYFAERFLVPRREFDDYCRWVAAGLDACRFGHHVAALAWDDEAGCFVADVRGPAGPQRLWARNVVLGVGTAPHLPAPLRGPATTHGDRVLHSAGYLPARERLVELDDVTVVGSGQSGAEVFLDLLRAQRPGQHRRWVTRTRALAPMEYSKLGLEQFTPDYTAYFRGLDDPVRERVLPRQAQLYKAISAETIADIQATLYEQTVGGGWPPATIIPNVALEEATVTADGVRLRLHEPDEDRKATLTTGAVVAATGYRPRRPTCIAGLSERIDWDEQGRYRVDATYRVATDPDIRGGLYVQNAELHTHGVGAPDLGLGAWRSATILNAVVGRAVHPLPARTAFTSFGLAGAR
ncbi:MAG: lysine N(6)-hydroxylase/L-ornithine N(5)-oxygenase family protein [Solirubrobacteraceae bacterium]